MPLNLQANFHYPDKSAQRDYSAGDDFYQLLIDTHRDLSDEASAALNARLILLLANHIGDISILQEALRLAADNNKSTSTR
ncbi:DUF2783 domain-containing protein [Undibacterium sp. Ji42W]|uniref:DUF2783 domain-containing protein n=1 Tax=Undibacterium sp. Ji42W TaxID=3413039 RepID=UPI003BF00125